jgi:RNA polymerase sigma factor (TIGR02999 family)
MSDAAADSPSDDDLIARPDPSALTRDLHDEDPQAGRRVLESVYDQLRGLARRYLDRERANHTLQPTELVNEACLKLLPMDELDDITAQRFLSFGARAMRQVLVDHARQAKAHKRGGDWIKVTMHDMAGGGSDHAITITSLDAALTLLERQDPDLAELTELHYFAGLTGDQLAQRYDTSRSSINRQLSLARALLLREIDRLESEI